MINSRTHPLAPPSGALVEGPKGVRVRFGGVQGGSQDRTCTATCTAACLTHQVLVFEDILAYPTLK
jgi:hypothetical protein